MSINLGETITRILRKDFLSGNEQFPKCVKQKGNWLEYIDHYYSMVKVHLPGKLKARWFIEMTPKQLWDLIGQEREDEKQEVTKRIDADRKKKTKRIKALKAGILEKDEEILTWRETASKAVARTRKVEDELSRTSKENFELWSENSRLDSLRLVAENRASRAFDRLNEKDAEIVQLNTELERQRQTIIERNTELDLLKGEPKERSPHSATTKTQRSNVKLTSSKPLDGPYGANQ
ncbi:hypothetical protein D3C81_1265810 [compost metagenome]